MSKIFLIPNFLSESNTADFLAVSNAKAIAHVRVFFVEEPKSARTLLRKLSADFPLTECAFLALNEHTLAKDIDQYMKEVGTSDMGIISEAGYPCVADPGADLVRLAHQKGIQIVPLAGASSIILALAASGLNGQNFAFNGYLPKDRDERLNKIRMLEQRSMKEKQTQIIMDAPYRNQALFEDLTNTCHPKTLLCVAVDVSGKDERIKTASIEQWKKSPYQFEKMPTLFLLLYNC